MTCTLKRKASKSENNYSFLRPKLKISRKITNISESLGQEGTELSFLLNTKSQVIHKLTIDERRAVKTISKDDVKDKDIFATEVQLLKKMDHPNIIKLYEVYETDKTIYLVT